MYNKNNLEVTAIAASNKYDDGRVVFGPRATWATDGHRLMLVTRSRESNPSEYPPHNGRNACLPTREIMVSKEDGEKMKKMIPKIKHMPILANIAFAGEEDEKPIFYASDLSAINEIRPIQRGTPPKLKGIFPHKKPVFSISVNAKILSELLRAISNTLSEHRPFVKLDFFSGDEAIRIKARNQETGQSVIALIMPVKD